jgi:hypothetical protein
MDAKVEATPTTCLPTHPCWQRVQNGTSIYSYGVTLCVAFAIYYIHKYLKAKEELWKLKYFTMQTYNLQEETKILQDIITLL